MTARQAAWRREVNFSINETDWYAGELLRQVVALEEIVFARWPRSALLRRRLRRELRASVRHIDGRTFADRRRETLATGWLDPRRQP